MRQTPLIFMKRYAESAPTNQRAKRGAIEARDEVGESQVHRSVSSVRRAVNACYAGANLTIISMDLEGGRERKKKERN